jgi:transglutaminase-like putative cysteine protease
LFAHEEEETWAVKPRGLLEVHAEFIVEDTGLPDEVRPAAEQLDVGKLPGEVLPFLLASRYCDTEKLSNLAWSLFGGAKGGWQRAQAICDYAHDRIDSATTMRAATAPLSEDKRDAAPFVGTSHISLSRFPAA